jgi:hypothetical protein
MNNKKAEDKIFSLLLETEIQIHQALSHYKEANTLCRFQVAERYNKFLKYLYDVRNLFWNLNRNQEIIQMSDQKNIREKTVYKYLISTEYIARVHKFLSDDKVNEKYCWGTGVINRTEKLIIPTEILTPKMSEQSPVFVRGDIYSIIDTLSYLEKFGHTLVIQCHKHPGDSPDSTFPSSIDLKTHKAMESFYPVIGLIFSNNGYLRFFSAEKGFVVEIYGKGVRQIEDTVFLIESDGNTNS